VALVLGRSGAMAWASAMAPARLARAKGNKKCFMAAPDPLVAVDQDVSASVGAGGHDDRQLPSVSGQGGQNPAVALPTCRPQRLVSAVQLVQLQVHGSPDAGGPHGQPLRLLNQPAKRRQQGPSEQGRLLSYLA